MSGKGEACVTASKKDEGGYFRRGDEADLRRGLLLLPRALFLLPLWCLGDFGEVGDFLRGDEEGERALRRGDGDLRRGDLDLRRGEERLAPLGDLPLRSPAPCLFGRSGAPACVSWNSLPPIGLVVPARVGAGMDVKGGCDSVSTCDHDRAARH